MKKFTKILLIGCLLVMVSCNNWLDVDPKSQVKDKDLFASEMGFKEALSGVYSLMTKEGLYGKELTFGWLGVLGQEWTSVPYNYEDDQKYDFENAASEVRIDSVWTGLYNAIANANKLLKEMRICLAVTIILSLKVKYWHCGHTCISIYCAFSERVAQWEWNGLRFLM